MVKNQRIKRALALGLSAVMLFAFTAPFALLEGDKVGNGIDLSGEGSGTSGGLVDNEKGNGIV